MAYQIKWGRLNVVLVLRLENTISLLEMREVERCIMAELDLCNHKIVLVIDANQMTVDYTTLSILQKSQNLTQHPNLKQIIMFAEQKLTRTVFLMAYSLARIQTLQFADSSSLTDYLQRFGTISEQISLEF